MPNNYIEQREKEFDEKWKRMRENGFGKHASLDDRMIWNVDPEDEDSWVFADKTLKSFHHDSLNGLKDLILGEIERRKGYTRDMYTTQLNQALDDLSEFIKSIQ